MYFASAQSLLTLLLVSSASVTAAAVEKVKFTRNLETRQVGGGPATGVGGWDVAWKDSTIKEPTSFVATSLGGSAYDLTFQRDASDTKYLVAYYIDYGQGESSGTEETEATNVGFTGAADGSVFQTFSAHLPSAKSTRFDTPITGFTVYFTPAANPSQIGYLKEVDV